MIPGMNPKQMQRMMKQMGVKQEQLDVAQAVLILSDGSKLVFDSPEVSKVNMMGQETFQLVGKAVKEEVDSTPEVNEEDVQTVMDQTGASQEDARKAIDDADGDLAEAIMSLAD